MSDRSIPLIYSRTALSLAVLLGRERAGLYKTTDDILEDVEALMLAGIAVKQALDEGHSPAAAYDAAFNVADGYSARIVCAGEVEGVLLGLCFRHSSFGEPGAVFRIS